MAKATKITGSGIVARVVAAPTESRFNNNVHEVRLVVNHSYKDKTTDEWKDTGSTWLTYSAVGDFGAGFASAAPGDTVEITGDWVLETRSYTKQDGTDGIAQTVRYGNIEIIARKGENAQSSASDDSAEEPF